MLTAAVRDLFRFSGGGLSIAVETSTPELWENNPYIEAHRTGGPRREPIDCEYRLIDRSNRVPVHFLDGFVRDLAFKLGIPIQLTEFKGDIHLSEKEREFPVSLLGEASPLPLWIISAGGKRDFTVKWWDVKRYQQVVDHFRGRLQFVQVGAAGHFHPELRGVIDLRGRTSIRQLIQLVHHSQGVVTPVSFLMHLAAAVEVHGREQRSVGAEARPCIVIAGGREAPHWEAYPTHQFLHTVGMLPCCLEGGCWRARTRPLGDGSEFDEPRRLCVDVSGNLPRCMDMISASDVIRRMELYLDGQKPAQPVAENPLRHRVVIRSNPAKVPVPGLTDETAKEAIEAQIEKLVAYSGKDFLGRGIVICAGGEKYLPSAWVCVKMLRHTGCALPIQIWHLGENEMPPEWRRLFTKAGVELIDALSVARRHRVRRLGGWEMKAYALLRSRFEEVILIDADNVALVDPALLFETSQYKRNGVILWPDISRLEESDPIWTICGIPYRDEPAVESGQIVVDKRRCWKPLALALWFNEHSDFFYKRLHGDKETFHLAFRKMEIEYAMPKFPVRTLKATMCQHNFRGRRIFQHRNLDKWRLDGSNLKIEDFREESLCRQFMADLRAELGYVAPTIPPEAEPRVPAPSRKKRDKKPRRQILAPKRSTGVVLLRAPINGHTGYGLHACQISNDFAEFGLDVRIAPTKVSETFIPVPDAVRARFVSDDTTHDWELLLHPPVVKPPQGRRIVFFTMWETTQLSAKAVDNLNRAEMVIVPCRWNALCFRSSGVTRPIHVVPLGINTDVFRYAPMNMTGPCVFGAGGRLVDSDPARKRVDDVIEWFQEAFPKERDVFLSLKIFPDCEAPKVSDKRIRIIREYYHETEMAAWFRTLTCFVSGARAEGWGLMQHQALATGRPIIGSAYGGVAEYFDSSIGYSVPYDLIPAEGRFSGLGLWSQPNREASVEAMRRVYKNRKEAAQFGENAAARMSRLSWRNASRELLTVLQDTGFLPVVEEPPLTVDNEIPPKT